MRPSLSHRAHTTDEDGACEGGALGTCEGDVLRGGGWGDGQESPLWTHPRVTITPHVAAMTFPEDVASTFLDNLERHLAGQPLRFQLDWEQGY